MPGTFGFTSLGCRMLENPFPGMNPYLERHWGDVHTAFMVYARDQLNEQLPIDLQARVEEGLAVDVDDSYSRFIYPDIRVVEDPGAPFELQADTVGVAIAEPTVVQVADDPITERHIEIVDSQDGQRVITAIEVLSPTNKRAGTGQDAYLQKQAEYIKAGINLVEIDLLRSGKFSLAMPEGRWPRAIPKPYKICIRQVRRPSQAFAIGGTFREPLPNINIPLRQADPAVALQLQELINDCYRRGRYAGIRYTEPLDPPFSTEDQAWVEALLREKSPTEL
ncbi:MAG: DUF4058 family protein [Planctomycetota bacterium]|nr:DUF4058 family protein [Planctomycetota bacterium]